LNPSILDSQIRNLTADLEQTREQLDEEQETKIEFQRQVTKLNAEVQQWRAKYESEGKKKKQTKTIFSVFE
jgi:chromosome segregation ATPase